MGLEIKNEIIEHKRNSVEVKSFKEIERIEKRGNIMPNTENLQERRGFAQRFKTVKERVKSILKRDEYARRNYLWLSLLYWADCGQIKIIIPQNMFQRVNSPESICRAYRKLHEEAKKGDPALKFLLKDNNTDLFRQSREKEIRGYFAEEKQKEVNGGMAKIIK